MKKFLSKLVIFVFSTFAFSQAILTKTDQRMLWRIDGTSQEGSPSTVYILGTIHMADENLYPFSEEILNAFNSADRLAAELSSEDFDEKNMARAMMPVMFQSLIFKPELKITNNLTSEQNEKLHLLLSEKEIKVCDSYAPWVTIMMITQKSIKSMDLKTEYGVDMMLMKMAKEQERHIIGLDDIQTQINVMAFGDYDSQLIRLKDSLDEFETLEEYNKKLKDELETMYQAYKNDDVQKIMETDMENEKKYTDSNDIYKEYYSALKYKRNEDWANQITKFIQDGGTTFIFVGAAHLCCPETVFDYLRKMGTIQ